MAEPLKNGLGPDVAELITGLISRVHPDFPARQYLAIGLDGYEELELTDRGRHLCKALRATLPDDPEVAINILIASLGPEEEGETLRGMQAFRYLPYSFFVSQYGLQTFETSMRAMYELTKRFTSEQCIRAFLVSEQERTLNRLREWTQDPSHHVRRLVSEGTRPRLPWAGRLKEFQRDPTPVLELLELLKDDPSDYVRRSVANNLNDIARDHPDVTIATCAAWSVDATPQRQQLIRHALRGLIKQGNSGALAVLGARHGADAEIRLGKVKPDVLTIGDTIALSFEVINTGNAPERFVIDYCVHFVKANGETSAKVFKLSTIELESGGSRAFSRRLSVQQRTTRIHYPGIHRVEVLVNGTPHPIGSFELLAG